MCKNQEQINSNAIRTVCVEQRAEGRKQRTEQSESGVGNATSVASMLVLRRFLHIITLRIVVILGLFVWAEKAEQERRY